MSLKLAKTTLLTSSMLLILSQASFALDATKFEQLIKDAFAKNGAGIEFSSINVDGDNVVIEGAEMVSGGEEFPIGQINMTGVKELDDGSYRVDVATVQDLDFAEKDVKFTMTGIEIGGLRIPAENSATDITGFMLYESVTTGPATFTHKGLDVFKMSGSEFVIDIPEDLSEMAFDGSLDGISIDLATVSDPKAKAMIASMGYEKLTGDVQMKGDWNAETGRFNMPEYALTINDAGRLNLAFDISGYTTDFIKQLQEIQTQMAANSDPKAQQAAGMASLGLMQQLTLNGVSIRFDDASLTEKALKVAGAQQNMSPEQAAQTAKALLPFVLGRLGMPELQAQITAAASTFLDNPQNIEIKAAPENPVPFGQIFGSAMADPRTIPSMIGVEVLANQ